MLDASSTWTPQDSSNGHTQFGASDFEETRLSEARVSFRLRTFVELRPSTTARSLDLKCQIDVRFKAIKVEQLQIVSNARNVELYLARESGTFEYASTTRGQKVEGAQEQYQVEVNGRFESVAAVRLRMLSLRGTNGSNKLALQSILFDCTLLHLTPSPVPRAPAHSKRADLQLEHLATIGTQLLYAAERRVCQHVDSACDRLARRLEHAISSQEARLSRIEALLQAHTVRDSVVQNGHMNKDHKNGVHVDEAIPIEKATPSRASAPGVATSPADIVADTIADTASLTRAEASS